MKVIRCFFSFLLFVFFFVLGVSAADKAYLSQSVVGICIVGDDSDRVSSVRAFIEKGSYTDMNDLYQQISCAPIDAEICIARRYFDDNVCDMGQHPDAVYDTVMIELSDEVNDEILYLMQIDVPQRLYFQTDIPFASLVQKHYTAFLSLIGKAEKFFIDSIECFDI